MQIDEPQEVSPNQFKPDFSRTFDKSFYGRSKAHATEFDIASNMSGNFTTEAEQILNLPKTLADVAIKEEENE